MNFNYTKNLLTATIVALFALLALFTGSKILLASLAVVAALTFLAVLELRGPGCVAPNRQPKSRLHA